MVLRHQGKANLEIKKNEQIPFFQKIDHELFFQQAISTIMGCGNVSEVTISAVHLLDSIGRIGSNNESYLVDFLLQRRDGSLKPNKIVVKHVGSNKRLYKHLKNNEKSFSNILSIKIPSIKYIDIRSGFIFRDFITGTSIDEILVQIMLQNRIKNWQKLLFEKIGLGLAELNLNLKIVHGDSRTANWIFEEENRTVYLIDWDDAGIGDPAYDLSKLIYSIGRKFSKIIYNYDLETQIQMIYLFDQLCLAIITGYSKVDLDRSIIKQLATYWIHYLFSVHPQIHERIFFHSNHLPRVFRVIRILLAPFTLTSGIKGKFVTQYVQKTYKLLYSAVSSF